MSGDPEIGASAYFQNLADQFSSSEDFRENLQALANHASSEEDIILAFEHIGDFIEHNEIQDENDSSYEEDLPNGRLFQIKAALRDHENIWQDILTSRARNLSASQVSRIYQALSKIKKEEGGGEYPFSGALKAALESRLLGLAGSSFEKTSEGEASLSPKEAASILAVYFDILGRPNNPKLFLLLDNYLIQGNEGISSQDAIDILDGYCELDIYPSDNLFTLLQEVLSQDDVILDDLDLVVVCSSLANLGREPIEGLRHKIETLALSGADNLDDYDAISVFWSLAVFSSISMQDNPDSYKRAAQSLFESKISTINENKRAIHSACLWFDIELPGDSSTLLYPERQSPAESRLRNIFTSSGLPINENKISIEEMLHHPDMSLVQDGKTILVELDGQQHFIFAVRDEQGYEPAGFNGSTLLRSALIRKFRPNDILARISFRWLGMYSDGESHFDSGSIQELARSLFDLAPGAYILDSLFGKTQGKNVTFNPQDGSFKVVSDSTAVVFDPFSASVSSMPLRSEREGGRKIEPLTYLGLEDPGPD